MSKTVQVNEQSAEQMKMDFKQPFNNERRIVLFQNKQRTKLEDPVMRGNVVVNGIVYNISIWTKVMVKDGQQEYYMQGQLKPAAEQTNATPDIEQFMDKSQVAISKK